MTMSLLEVIVFIAVLCAVNAAVTVNIYEDDVDTVKTKRHEVEHCLDEECRRVCRFLGFNSGSCAGDACECRKQQTDDDQLERNDIPSLDENGTGKGLAGCDPNACDQLCRRLQFPSGTCINGRCKCDNFRQKTEAVIENTVKDAGKCNNLKCRQICHRFGFRYGVCVGDTCRCSNALGTDVVDFSLDQDINEDIDNSVDPNVDTIFTNAATCDKLACMMGCQELRFSGGSCFMGKCRCNKGDVETVKTKRHEVERCVDEECHRACRDFGFNTGSCAGDACECRKQQTDDDQLERNDIPSLDENGTGKGLAGCDPNACDQLCRRLQFPSGTCINGRCKCDNFRQKTEAMIENTVKDAGKCNNLKCRQICHRFGFRYGVCVGDICRCSNALGTDVLDFSLDQDINEDIDNSVDPDVDTIFTNAATCMMGCQELGFSGGSCFMGKCSCNKGDQLERNDIPSLDEDDTGKGLAGCNPNACEQLCRRLQFSSGTCINGRCKCYNFRQKTEAMIENTVKDAGKCNDVQCRQICHRIGFRYGVCVGNTCRCSNALRTDEAMIENTVKDAGKCNAVKCRQTCQRFGFRYGVCVGDTCRCSNALRTDVLEFSLDQDKNEDIDNSVDPNVDTIFTNAASCDKSACMMGCQELGFSGGSCFMGKCRCNKGDNERKSSISMQECNNVNCVFKCRSWGYIGGSCRDDRCLCV